MVSQPCDASPPQGRSGRFSAPNIRCRGLAPSSRLRAHDAAIMGCITHSTVWVETGTINMTEQTTLTNAYRSGGWSHWLPAGPLLARFRTNGGSEPHDRMALKTSNTQPHLGRDIGCLSGPQSRGRPGAAWRPGLAADSSSASEANTSLVKSDPGVRVQCAEPLRSKSGQ